MKKQTLIFIGLVILTLIVVSCSRISSGASLPDVTVTSASSTQDPSAVAATEAPIGTPPAEINMSGCDVEVNPSGAEVVVGDNAVFEAKITSCSGGITRLSYNVDKDDRGNLYREFSTLLSSRTETITIPTDSLAPDLYTIEVWVNDDVSTKVSVRFTVLEVEALGTSADIKVTEMLDELNIGTAVAQSVEQTVAALTTNTPGPSDTPMAVTATDTVALIDVGTPVFLNNTFSGTVPGGTWIINGVPESVIVDNIAIIGVDGVRFVIKGAENMLADPGVFSTEDCELADSTVSALCTFRANVQQTFSHEPPAFMELPEGSEEGHGRIMYSGAYMELLMPDGVLIEVDSDVDVSWMIIVEGDDGDGQTPLDGNNQPGLLDYNPGFTMGTIYPPGKYFSAEHLQQNAEAAINNECGNDGCSGGVAVLTYRMSDQSFSVVFYNGDEWLAIANNWGVAN